MHLNVIQIAINVIKPANALQSVYTRQNAAFKISRANISAAALFRKQYPIAFTRKRATPNKLGMF